MPLGYDFTVETAGKHTVETSCEAVFDAVELQLEGNFQHRHAFSGT